MENLALNTNIDKNVIENFETFIKQNYENVIDTFPLEHFFSGGIYARQMIIPAEAIATGAIHKYDHIVTISKGDGYLVDEFGGHREYKAPITFETKAGTKRAIQTITETIFTTYHKCDTTNIDEVRELLVCETVAEYNLFLEQEKLKIEG